MQIIIKIKKETNNIFMELKKYVIPANAYGRHKILCHSRESGNLVLQNFFKARFISLYAGFPLSRE